MASTRSKEIRSGAQKGPVKQENIPKKAADIETVKLMRSPNSKNELDGPSNPYGGSRTCSAT